MNFATPVNTLISTGAGMATKTSGGTVMSKAPMVERQKLHFGMKTGVWGAGTTLRFTNGSPGPFAVTIPGVLTLTCGR